MKHCECDCKCGQVKTKVIRPDAKDMPNPPSPRFGNGFYIYSKDSKEHVKALRDWEDKHA